MSVRKLAGLAAGFALAVGLIGGGVSAAFTDQVTAVQHISVGTLDCGITTTAANPIYDTADTLGAHHSVTFNAPEIVSSAAANSPFPFTVTNVGSISTVVTLTSSWGGTLDPAKFSDMLGVQLPVTLPTTGANHLYAGGIAWTELDNLDLTKSGSITYAVTCGEVLG